MVDLDLQQGFFGTPLEVGFLSESGSRMTIDSERLGLEAGTPFLIPDVVQVPTYDFNLDATCHDSPTHQPIGLLEPIEISLGLIKRAPSRAFGAAEPFEGDGFLAAAAIAGAIGILALVGGGIYLTYQLQQAAAFGAELLRPSMALGEAVVEAIIPEPEE